MPKNVPFRVFAERLVCSVSVANRPFCIACLHRSELTKLCNVPCTFRSTVPTNPLAAFLFDATLPITHSPILHNGQEFIAIKPADLTITISFRIMFILGGNSCFKSRARCQVITANVAVWDHKGNFSLISGNSVAINWPSSFRNFSS